jgi:hypothetical protein
MGTAEWEDILVSHGIVPAKPNSPAPYSYEDNLRISKDSRYVSDSKDEDFSDSFDETDPDERAAMNSYRYDLLSYLSMIFTIFSKKRVENSRVHFQEVVEINQAEFQTQVSEASRKMPVIALLFENG